MATYLLAFFLTAIHLYSQATAIIVSSGEIILLAWLHKRDLQVTVNEILQDWFAKFKDSISTLVLQDAESAPSGLIHSLLTLALAGFAIARVIWAVRIFIGNLGSVFDTWDAVVSWNRWALDWASGQIPSDSGLYPQLIPANWSFAYVFTGNTVVQAFAKGIMPLFAIFILLLFLDLGFETKNTGFFIGAIFTQLLIKKFLAAEITNGYVDVAVAFFGLLAIHALIKAGNSDNASQSDQYLLLGAVFAAGAGVVKQPGLYIFALYPLLAYINPLARRNRKKYVVFYLLILLIPLSWYVLQQIHSFRDISSDFQEYFTVTARTYGNISLTAQIAAAFSRFEIYLLLFVFIALGFPLLDPFQKALAALIVFPYPLIWAWVAGYDTRNLAIFIPFFAMTAGIALQKLYALSIKILDRTIFRLKAHSVLAIFMATLILGSLAVSPARLVEQQIQQRMQIFSPSKNEKIYAIIEQDGPDTKILTDYPVRFLPGLENNHVHFAFQNFETFQALLEDPAIRYIFFSNKASDDIKHYVEEKMNAGDYELVFRDEEWITYRMIRIIKRR